MINQAEVISMLDKIKSYFKSKVDVVFIVFTMLVILGVMHHLIFIGSE